MMPIISISLVCMLASFSVTFFSDAIARIPGNSHLDVPVTFIGVCDTFLGKFSTWAVRLFTVLSLFSGIIVCIAQTAQVRCPHTLSCSAPDIPVLSKSYRHTFEVMMCVLLQVFDSMVVLFSPSRTTYAIEISIHHIRTLNWTATYEYDESDDCGQRNSAPFQVSSLSLLRNIVCGPGVSRLTGTSTTGKSTRS